MTEQQPITAEHFLYGRPGAEELGDVIWYVDRLLMMVGATVDQAMQANLDKLRRRYPHGWDAASKHYDHERSESDQ